MHRSTRIEGGVGVKPATSNGGGTNLPVEVEVGVIGWLDETFTLFKCDDWHEYSTQHMSILEIESKSCF